MILIIGSDGSMGKRYQAILGYLGRKFICADKEASKETIRKLAEASDGVIVATPTDTHVSIIRGLMELRRPILCEKPVTKDVAELRTFSGELRKARVPFKMMYQYSVLNDPLRIGRSFYNYFRHGADGLYWDCIQPISLARGQITIGQDSPVWSCMLNGKTLRLSDMDAAYISYVQDWFKSPSQDMEIVCEAHEKVQSMIDCYGSK